MYPHTIKKFNYKQFYAINILSLGNQMKYLTPFTLITIISSLGIAYAASGNSNDPGYEPYPYPDSPLELEQEARNAMPNILLFMDNSWSMKRPFRYDPKKRERLFFSKNVAKHILAKYGNAARWGLASYDPGSTTLNGSGDPYDNSGSVYYRQGNTGYNWDYRAGGQAHYANAARVGAKIIIPISDPTTGQFKKILAGIDELRYKWHTPMTSALYEMSRYYRGMTSAYNKPIPGKPYDPTPTTLAYLESGQSRYTTPIQYRCQRNMILMVTDDRPYATYNWRNLWPAVNDPHLGQNITKEPFDTRHATRVNNTRDTLGLDWGSLPLGPQGQLYDYIDFAGMYTEDGGLQFIAKYMNQLDMVRKIDRPYGDLEGKSFDDPAFPKQTIETHFLGFDGPADQSFARRTDLDDGGDKRGWARLGRAAAFGSRTPLYDADGSIQRDDNNNIIYGSGVFHEAKMSSSDGVIASLDAMLTEAFQSTTEYSPIAAVPMNLSGQTVSKIVSTVNVITWSSQIKFMKVKADGSVDKKNFSRPNYTKTKKVLINTPNGIRSLSETQTENGITFNNAFFGITSPLSKSDEWRTKLVPWLLRKGASDSVFVESVPIEDMITQPPMIHPGEPGYGNGGEFGVAGTKDADGYRIRDNKSPFARNIGDIIDSPMYLLGDATNTGRNMRHKYLMVGANDGMLHVYKASTSINDPYELVFGYIPGAAPRTSQNDILLNGLRKTAAPNYGSPQNPHQYFVNGEMMYHETSKGHLFAVGTLGKGGRAAYALNIAGKQHGTNNLIGLDASMSSWEKTVPLWDTSTDNFGDPMLKSEMLNIGYTISQPTIGRLALVRNNGTPNLKENVRFVSLLANGYDGAEKNPTLYIQDALGLDVGIDASFNGTNLSKAGHLIKKLSPETLIDKNGLSSPIAVDIDFDGVIDIAYAGDTNGNVYRFDFRGDSINDWSATLIFRGNEKQPITSAPSVYKHKDNSGKYTVIFGTGSALYLDDLTDDTVQRLYGIVDDTNLQPSNIIPIEGDNNLLEQTLVQIGDGQRGLSNHLLTAQHKGWFINLQTVNNPKQDGERIVTQGQMIGGTFAVTTRAFSKKNDPNESVCKPEEPGYGWLITVDVAAGGGGKKSPFVGHTQETTLNGTVYHLNAIRYDGTLSALAVNRIFKPGEKPTSTNANGGIMSGRSGGLGGNDPDGNPLVGDECPESGIVDVDLTSSKNTVGAQTNKVFCEPSIKPKPFRVYVRKRF